MRDDVPEQPGPAVGGYRIERLVGLGGMAAVYEARRLGRKGPGERVACKVMHARPAEPDHGELMRHEAVLGLRFGAGHPNLVRVLDTFDDAQGPEVRRCIVMELVDGASLGELRGPDRRLPVPVVRRIACEVLEALAHLHGIGVLHRDVSPRNILVTAEGAVKLADLGLAREMEAGEVQTRTFRATVAYASPESVQLLPCDARADLFSLAAALYDLLAGTPLSGALENAFSIIGRILQGNFPPLPEDTPSDLDELVTGLLQLDRGARWPQSAAEALALLREAGQPMATAEELAALVEPARARREAELAHARPAGLLPAGHVLIPCKEMPERMRRRRFRARRRAAGRVMTRRALARAAIACALAACVAVGGLVLHDRLGDERETGTPVPVEHAQPREAPAPVSPEPASAAGPVTPAPPVAPSAEPRPAPPVAPSAEPRPAPPAPASAPGPVAPPPQAPAAGTALAPQTMPAAGTSPAPPVALVAPAPEPAEVPGPGDQTASRHDTDRAAPSGQRTETRHGARRTEPAAPRWKSEPLYGQAPSWVKP